MPLAPDPTLTIALDTGYKPLPGWDIREQAAGNRWDVFYDGATPFPLGRFFEYNGYPEGPTRGLARATGSQPKIPYEPADWAALGNWTELIFPTSWAESNANFAVINGWDRAAMTFGFIQLAAHTGEDFLPFFRKLFADLPAEAKQWFPELDVVGGKLCFVKGSSWRSLEVNVPPKDGGFSANYYHGDLMGFFNPDRYHKANPKADPEELHAAARWLIWTTTSPKMRELQVVASIDNLKGSLRFLHARMLADPAVKAKFPKGVDGMKCDLLSVALAVPHLGEGHIGTVLSALTKSDPIEAIRASGYGPAGRAQNTHDGMKRRPKLPTLTYNLAANEPV